MLWQPFVENAVKHAITPRISPGTIVLRARKADADLELQVRDDGPGIPENVSFATSAGVGIRNAIDRLNLLFPRTHRICFVNNEGGGLTVTVTIPFTLYGEGFTGGRNGRKTNITDDPDR